MFPWSRFRGVACFHSGHRYQCRSVHPEAENRARFWSDTGRDSGHDDAEHSRDRRLTSLSCRGRGAHGGDDHHRDAGAALGILADGREEHATFGVDRIERDMPVTGDTLFQIGSITKTFTGTAVMRLVDQGALDLNATVRTYLPDFRLENEDVAARATLRHLLTHTGGWWGDFFVDTGAGDDAIARYVEQWVPTLPQLTPLGEYVNYNNSGFTLLGRLIEVATGQEYRAALHALVLDPLGLNSSVFAPDEVTARPHADGHFTEHGSTRSQEPLFLPRAVDPRAGSGRPHRICSATRASISATVQPQASPSCSRKPWSGCRRRNRRSQASPGWR